VTIRDHTFVHHKSRARRQRFTTVANVARWYGVATETVTDWIHRGHLRAHRAWQQHYTDERPRKTGRGRWRIYEADLRDFVAKARGGELRVLGVGRGFWKGSDGE